MMKKLLCLLLAAALIAAACTPQTPDEPAGGEPPVIISPTADYDPEHNAENNGSADPLENPDELANFVSEPIVLGEGTEWAVDGILTMPLIPGERVPAVVLVHGSGAHDMDETIFENKPFRDIAEYLSNNGIAVLRYDMRTFTHGQKMLDELGGSLTVWHEKIEDAIFAAELLRADPRIYSDKIFMLGHSMGGMLAPQIHEMGGDFAGLIIFAGSPRFLLDISKDQNIAFLEDMYEGEELETRITQFERLWDLQIGALMNLSDEEAKETEFEAGIHVYYFKDMYNNPSAKFIENIMVPFLVMHPENDMQVCAEKDFGLYRELLAGRDNVTFKLYEDLNHLFMPGEKTAITELMEQYEIPGNVDSQVLADIAEWIHAS
ncbi:MAG: alpha/beta fold hydrolase [Oscillospiraceae bacterium]|jgi:dipeptidyl aminopeptidase/acylaminoacyl peptidase|nr:alpha/beta fold hydrolase [Oscillospiraceae bacterium]